MGGFPGSSGRAPFVRFFHGSMVGPEREPTVSYEPTASSMHSSAWVAFTQINFAVSTAAVAVAIWAMPATIWIRAFLGLGLLAVIGATITMTKTLRDLHEAGKVTSKVETAKVERLLTDFDPTAV